MVRQRIWFFRTRRSASMCRTSTRISIGVSFLCAERTSCCSEKLYVHLMLHSDTMTACPHPILAVLAVLRGAKR